MNRRILDPEATRTAILDAAQDLFVQRGFAAVSLADIAAHAGVTKSLIPHHFGAKEDLWRASVQRLMAEYFEAQKAILETDGPDDDLLERSIVTYFRFLQKHPHIVRMLNWLHAGEDPTMLEAGDVVTRMGVQRIEAGQAQGLIRADLEPRSIILAFLGMVQHWFTSRGTACAPGDLAQDAADEVYLRTVLRIFFDGVRTQPR